MNTWDIRKTVGAIAVAAAIAGVGGAAIAAATDDGHHGMEGFMRGGPGGPPPGAAAPHRVDAPPDSLHGENVVAADQGGFTKLLTQTGTITAISPSSVTARSADGFTQTYVIRAADQASGPQPFAVGDDVTIDATREGEAATVSTMRPPLSAGRMSGL